MDTSDFDRIRKTLDATHDWPALFMFKFIVPSDNEKIAQVESLFNATTAEIRLRPSKNGNYTSITAKEIMLNAEAVLERYEQAGKIEGLLSL